MNRATLALAAGLAAAAFACASRVETPASRAFARPEDLLEGFDAAEPGADWRLGDRVLFSVDVDDRGASERWFILCELEEALDFTGLGGESFPVASSLELTYDTGEKRSFQSIPRYVRVNVFTRDGVRLGGAKVTVPELSLRNGFHGSTSRIVAIGKEVNEAAATQPGWKPGAAVESEVKNRFFDLITSLFGFLELFRQTPPLEAVRARLADVVVDAPSILNVLVHFGVSIDIRPDFRAVEPRASDVPSSAGALALPIEFDINEALAFRYRLVVVPPDPPLQVAAGVIAIEGEHPSDPSRRFTIRLLAARRGPALAPAADGTIAGPP
ncbi:MAG TPA: hypothetical protein VKE69_13215 [Planctomycetota bacterium]|nr:hypothetical protein [Planctomycetota bacterium]